MYYNINDAINILNRTPDVLDILLRDLPEEWTHSNEGEKTWSPFDVLGHLIHGEHTDWITRLEIILSEGGNKKFATFDRFAQFEESLGKTMIMLLDEFRMVRKKNIEILKSKKISEALFGQIGIHPRFGEVTLKNLLATWVAHDLDHIAQISRVMAYQYKEEVGPWTAYMRIYSGR